MQKEQVFDNQSISEKSQHSLDLSTIYSVACYNPKPIQRKPQVRSFERRKRLTQKAYRKQDFVYISPGRQDNRDNFKDLKQYTSTIIKNNQQHNQVQILIQKQKYCTKSIKNLISIGQVKFNKSINEKNNTVISYRKCQNSNQKKYCNFQDEKFQNFEQKQQSQSKSHKNKYFYNSQYEQIINNQPQLQSQKIQIKKLKIQNDQLLKKIEKLQNELNILKTRNKSLEQKITLYQQQIVLYKRNQQILQKQFSKQQNNKKMKQQLRKYLQDIITNLNTKIDILLNNNQKLEGYNFDLAQDASEKLQKIQSLQNYIQKINYSIKYHQIQNRILKKKIFQLKQKEEDIQQYKNNNKKLKIQVQSLYKFRKSILEDDSPRKNRKNYRKRQNIQESQDSILFCLSPQ